MVPDGAPTCALEEPSSDRLQKLNVVQSTAEATASGEKGTAPYTSTTTTAKYQDDNLPTRVKDGLERGIDVPVPAVDASDDKLFYEKEMVSTAFDYDHYGRLKRPLGGAVSPGAGHFLERLTMSGTACSRRTPHGGLRRAALR